MNMPDASVKYNHKNVVTHKTLLYVKLLVYVSYQFLNIYQSQNIKPRVSISNPNNKVKKVMEGVG